MFFLSVIVAMHIGLEDILIIALFPFVILTAAYNTTMIKKVLDTPVLQQLGDSSFIYIGTLPIILSWIYQIRMNPTMIQNFP